MLPASHRYPVGGSLSVDSPYYVERPADALLYEALTVGDFCYVLNSRQMGKSSLLVRTKYRLEQQGTQCVALDLTGIGGIASTPEQWYKGIFVQICLDLNLLGKVNFKLWWKDHADLPLAQRITLFIRDILRVYIPDRSIVILVDEIDTVLSLSFSSDDFFALIRFCYNQRSIDPNYHRIAFALFGVANPANLIQDPQRTPFNIGQAIPLQGFTIHQTEPLMRGLKLPYALAFDILKEILSWTGGQPLLTQKLCKIVGERLPQNLLLEDSAPTQKVSLTQPIADFIEGLIYADIIGNWESKDTPEHLLTISKRILSNAQMTGRLLGIYQRILANDVIKLDYSPEHIELLLSGLVINQDEVLQSKNRIYRAVFNVQWVNDHLEQLRPYAQQLNVWCVSQQQSDHLLTGFALKEALAWAQDKQLSDLDYRFLGASQALDNQSTAQELATERQERAFAERMVSSLQTATQVFAEARQTARKQVRHVKLGRRWIGGIAAGVTGGVLVLRLTGILQGLEWLAFDQIVQRLPSPGLDSRITIITVDEPDIQVAGSYPLSGQVLADCLQMLNRYQPRGIGLDIYRDVPVEPGHGALVQELSRSPHLIGVEQVIEPTIAVLPVLAKQGQMGFGDQVVDGDGTIRRATLSIKSTDGTSLHLSFALQLALNYLATEGITPEDLAHGWTQLGQATIKPFEPNTSGFYVGAEDGGYQMLLNYHGPITGFQQVSLADVLAGQVDPEVIRDRIVLIGFTAESVNDLFPSPYSNRIIGSSRPMPGIVVHANVISQLLSATLDGRPLLQVWPQSGEWLWIAVWAGIGATITWKIRSMVGQIFGVAIATGSLLGLAIVAFAHGWWIPLVPPLFTLVGAAIILPVATAKHMEMLQLRQTVTILMDTVRDNPLVGEIAIAYLKQVEGQEPARLALIEQCLDQANVKLGQQAHPLAGDNCPSP
ncbi:CHASE2 domain-containing protein [Leptothoe spongobia]|uniref:CHASE2 domain-containing protein n=1 Tax=Leptothoe spongobia TAU-MAC 1115 TaxID=1967444 RepID=A0A947GG71_9CYAN|nr:CHASE2 domain-containing protein [Leptothoe spongobia]MBT9314008.1 CHASE2 domain-containing protein [Leptothoe spongobia TAU-MAC 1115]